VILKDLIPLIRQFLKSAMWNYLVFQYKDYQPYTYHVTVIIKEGEWLSQLTVLTQALLVLTNYLKIVKA